MSKVNQRYFTDLVVLFLSIGLYFLGIYFYDPGNWAFLGTDLHPFFLISILYSSYYGIRHAAVSSLLFSALYLGLVANQVDFQEVESLFLIKFLKLPVLLSFMSVAVGEVRQRTFKRNRETHRKLTTSTTVNNELENKLHLASVELVELQKRYATLTESFAENVRLVEELEDKGFEEIIEISTTYLKNECHIGEVKFYAKNGPGVHENELKVINRLGDSSEIYSIKEDLEKNESDRLLDHVAAEIVIPLTLSGKIIGHFFLEKIPFLSMNIFNVKKIENVIRIVEISLGNTTRIQNWQDNSTILYPFDIYKKDAYFQELDRFQESMGHLLEDKAFSLFSVTMTLNFRSKVNASSKEKAILFLSHLMKEECHGVYVLGGDLVEDTLYLSFVNTKSEVQQEMKLLMVKINEIMENNLDSIIEPNFQIEKYNGDKREKLVTLT